MTAGRGPAASAASARSTSRPVIPGMWMSIRTSAGASSRIAASALTPSPRQPTSSSIGISFTHAASASRASGSSSAMRVLWRIVRRCAQPIGIRISTRKPAPGAERTWSSAEPSKSSSKRRLSALRPTPPALPGAGGQRQPAPSSRDRERERFGIGAAPRLDPHRAAGDLRRDAVDDAVLDQRLQRQRRDLVAERRRVDLPVDLQARAEAQRLEREVVANERELVLERDPVGRRARRVEHVTHHPREAEQRLLGGRRVLARQDQQRIERVEEKVRIELAADVGELGANQRRFGARRGDRDALRAARVERAGEAGDEREVREHAPHRAPEHALLERRRRVVGAEQAPGDDEVDQLPGDDEDDRADDVPGDGRDRVAPAALQPAHPRQDERAEDDRRAEVEGRLVDAVPEAPGAAIPLGAGHRVEQPAEHAQGEVAAPEAGVCPRRRRRARVCAEVVAGSVTRPS